MTTRVDTEDIASTKSEKFLAVVLTVFILIGAGWGYVKSDDLAGVHQAWQYTAAEQQAFDEQSDASERFYEADEMRNSAKVTLDLAREDLSLAVDRGESTAELETSYRQAQQKYSKAIAKAQAAKEASDRAEAAATQANESYEARGSNGSDWRQWLSAALRLALIGALTLGGFRLIGRLRERDSRYMPLGFAVVGAGVIMAFVFAVDYITDYIDILDLGPIVLSLMGMAATIGAFVALQKYLARRVPRARVRKGECPFCGFPVRPDAGPHCEGCGRDVVAQCSSCEGPRRVGSPHCPRCGTA